MILIVVLLTVESVVKRLSGDGPGYSDGEPSSARFEKPKSFAVDMKGNIYVADQSNHVIRKITNLGLSVLFLYLIAANSWISFMHFY